MTAESVFPKISGDCAYASEWNAMYAGGLAGYSVVDASMENAMNITILQYCVNISDIPHDYMVVDSFTRNCGYNASICVASTTSIYCGSGLTGSYNFYVTTNCATNPPCCVFDCNCTPATGVVTTCDWCFNVFAATGDGSSIYASAGICVTDRTAYGPINCFCALSWKVCGYLCSYSDSGCGDSCFRYANGFDDFSIQCTRTGGGGFGSPCTVLKCYCFVCVSSNCFCFYCNGTGKCQVTMTCFPCLIISGYGCDNQVSIGCSYGCIFNMCLCAKAPTATKIQTINTCFALPVKSVYLDLDKYGAGTIAYNVVKASDGTCLCCNLSPKCYYTMSTCCCCLRFEIIQCTNASSCVKSYAVAVSV